MRPIGTNMPKKNDKTLFETALGVGIHGQANGRRLSIIAIRRELTLKYTFRPGLGAGL